jgi:hypothetical protein
LSTTLDIAKLLLPEVLVEYFKLTKHEIKQGEFHFYFTELNKIPEEFEEFNLFDLSLERFALLHLCLQKDNILNNVPLKIKEVSIVKEEQITKEFYKDYSLFKRELYRDLVKNNIKRLKLESSLRGTKQSLN